MGRKRKDLVAVDNKVMDLDYSEFSVNECRLWFALLAEVRDKDTDEIELTFDEFARLAGVSKSNPSYITPLATKMAKKIQSLTALDKYDENMDVDITWFFRKFKISPKNGQIRFSVDPEYRKWVNELGGSFSKFELLTFTPLSMRASQEIFLQVKKSEYLKEDVVLTVEFLRERLNIPNYRTDNITDKIIKPAVKEINWLNSFGRELKFESFRENKKIAGYRFFFEAGEMDLMDEPW